MSIILISDVERKQIFSPHYNSNRERTDSCLSLIEYDMESLK